MRPSFENNFEDRHERPLPAREERGEQSEVRGHDTGHETETEQDRIIDGLLVDVGRLSIAARKLERKEKYPGDTRDLIGFVCAALQVMLEEQLHARHPELHPENVTGEPYRHRDETIVWLERVIRVLRSRDVRTLEAEATRVEEPPQKTE